MLLISYRTSYRRLRARPDGKERELRMRGRFESGLSGIALSVVFDSEQGCFVLFGSVVPVRMINSKPTHNFCLKFLG